MAQQSTYIGSVYLVNVLESARRDIAHSEKQVSAYFTSVQMMSFGSSVTRKERSDSEKAVYTCKSEHPQPLGSVVTRGKGRQVKKQWRYMFT